MHIDEAVPEMARPHQIFFLIYYKNSLTLRKIIN